MATFIGTAGNDTANAAVGQLSGFTGGTLAELQDLIGDRISGFAGEDSIFAGDGDDDIEGWDGSDVIDGGAGNDRIWAMEASHVSNSLFGDEITGNDGDDQIYGADGDDLLSGGAGNDILEGGWGADVLDGGSGFDVASYAGAGSGVVVDLALAVQTRGQAAEGDRLIGIEELRGSGALDLLYGNAGNNRLYGGGGGGDRLTGRAGNDTYVVDDARVNVVEAADEGYDTIETVLSTHTLRANLERLIFTDTGDHVGKGNALDNRLIGNAGNDKFIVDAGGNDIFSGGLGSDSVDFRTSKTGAVLDFASGVHGGAALGDTYASIEKFLGSDSAGDTMTGAGVGRFFFAGGGGGDTLTGGASIDQLLGQAGNDTLEGNQGRDSLDGGTGDDTLRGGTEADTFVFVDAGFGRDTIGDFQDGLDKLKVFSAVADDIADFTIVGNGSDHVVLTLTGAPANSISIFGLNGANITISASDIVFY